MVGSGASGGWKNYYMVGGEHMHIANLFLSNFIKVVVNFI
jgi:hypothetical protein